MFRLLRYFSFAALVTIVAAAIALSIAYRILALKELEHIGEQQNVNLTRLLSNSIVNESSTLIRTTRRQNTLDAAGLRALPIISRLDRTIKRELTDLPVLKVKIFDAMGRALYSTSSKDIGITKPANYPGHRSASTDTVISKLSYRESFNAINGMVDNRHILSSYLPIHDKSTGKVHGVLEIYTDVTASVVAINASQVKIAFVTVTILSLLYMALFLIVRRGEKIIRQQVKEREGYMAEIEKINEALSKSAVELAKARDQEQEANKAKSRFLTRMSHELRTPLNAIIGYSEMVCDDLESIGQNGLTSDIKRIRDSGYYLLLLINEILDLSKIEAGHMKLHFEDIDVNEIVNDVIETIQPMITNNANTLEVKCAPGLGKIKSDKIRMRQILLNLLSNASKFTKAGSVLFSAERTNMDGKQRIVFSIQDSGIGMSDEEISRVFEPFTQADDSTTRKYGGTGLGLTICKKFVEMMGGKIKIESEQGKGSTFTILLPA